VKAFIDGDPLLFIAEWKRTVQEAKVRIDELVMSISDSVFVDQPKVKIAVKGEGNFRYDILPTYKGDRQRDEDRQWRLNELRDHLIKEHDAVQAHGQEPDDLLAQWAHQCEDPFAICSIDKDLLTVPGIHFNIGKNIIEHVDNDRADYLFMQQLLTGDRVDCIPGLAGIGPAKSARLLEGIPYGKRMDAVKAAYNEVYGSGWKKELQLTCDLIYIRREEGVGYKIE